MGSIGSIKNGNVQSHINQPHAPPISAHHTVALKPMAP